VCIRIGVVAQQVEQPASTPADAALESGHPCQRLAPALICVDPVCAWRCSSQAVVRELLFEGAVCVRGEEIGRYVS
jgi:hypothetical protein